jgi:hypothetical protein
MADLRSPPDAAFRNCALVSSLSWPRSARAELKPQRGPAGVSISRRRGKMNTILRNITWGFHLPCQKTGSGLQYMRVP